MRPQRRTLRCAIYTGKSSDEGFGQAFNSLDWDAQWLALGVDEAP